MCITRTHQHTNTHKNTPTHTYVHQCTLLYIEVQFYTSLHTFVHCSALWYTNVPFCISMHTFVYQCTFLYIGVFYCALSFVLYFFCYLFYYISVDTFIYHGVQYIIEDTKRCFEVKFSFCGCKMVVDVQYLQWIKHIKIINCTL